MVCPVTGEPVCRCNQEHFSDISFRPTMQTILRKLFTDRAIYIRLYMISLSANLQDKHAILRRLTENQEDIAKVLSPENSETLELLLKEHISRIGEYVSCLSKTKNNDSCNPIFDKLVENGFKISNFLSGHVRIDFDKLISEWVKHNQLIGVMLILRKQKKWDQDIKTLDMYISQTLIMADTISSSLISNNYRNHY